MTRLGTNRLITTLLLSLLPLALLLTAQPANAAAPTGAQAGVQAGAQENYLRGMDISWPQCPKGVGRGEGKPIPAQTTPGLRYAVIGLNQGLPFWDNACLKSLVDYSKARHLAVGTYVVPQPPNAAQLKQYGTYYRFGIALARHNTQVMRNAGLRNRFIWIDVEPLKLARWQTGAKGQPNNWAVITGMRDGFHAAGVGTGFYSYRGGWNAITGGRRSTAPVWFTSGHSGWNTAKRRCAAASWSGGPIVLSQWYTETADFNVTCPKMARHGGFNAYFVQY